MMSNHTRKTANGVKTLGEMSRQIKSWLNGAAIDSRRKIMKGEIMNNIVDIIHKMLVQT